MFDGLDDYYDDYNEEKPSKYYIDEELPAVKKLNKFIKKFSDQYCLTYKQGATNKQLFDLTYQRLYQLDREFLYTEAATYAFNKLIEYSSNFEVEIQQKIIKDIFFASFQNVKRYRLKHENENWLQDWASKLRMEPFCRMAEILCDLKDYRSVALFILEILEMSYPPKKQTRSHNKVKENDTYEYSDYLYWEDVHEGEIDPTRSTGFGSFEIEVYSLLNERISFGKDLDHYIKLIRKSYDIRIEDKIDILKKISKTYDGDIFSTTAKIELQELVN